MTSGVRIPDIMITHFHKTFLFVMLILASHSGLYAQEKDKFDQDLLNRLHKYYKSERNGDWERAYSFRTPLYRKSVPFELYKKEMIHDNNGWKLISFRIIKGIIEDDYAAFKIEFMEQVPDGYFPNNIEKAIKLNEVSTCGFLGTSLNGRTCSDTHWGLTFQRAESCRIP